MAGGDQKVFVRNTSISPSVAGTLTYVDGNTSADRLDAEITSIPASGYHFSHCTATDVTTGEVLTSNVNPSIFRLIDFHNRTTYDVTADIVVYFEKDDTPTSTLTIGGKTVTDITISSKSVKSISIDGTIVWQHEQPQPVDYDYLYMENLYAGDNTFTLTKQGTPNSTDLQYSLDKTTWTNFDLTLSSQTVTVPQGGKIYLRSTTGFSKDNKNYFTLSMLQSCAAGGNIASVFDYENMDTFTTIPNGGCYFMFSGCTSLTTANIDMSSVTSVGDNGCQVMFYNCTSLTTAPDLSSVTSISQYGCRGMFYGCSSLTTAPDMSNVTTIGYEGCRQMFYGCSSLTTAPDMSSLTSIGFHGCDSMFNGCSSLTTAPDLSSLTSIDTNGCESMFSGCTSLTDGPDLMNVTSVGVRSFMSMFQGCSSLNYVTAPNISSWNTTNMSNWLSNVAATGVVSKPTNLTIPTDSASGIPTGWTTVNY